MSSIVDIQTAFIKGEIHMLDRVYDFLQVIEEKRSLNAFLTVYADEARAAAKDLDARRDAGETLGPLAGLVIALKDNICLENQKATCGSKILEDFVSPYSATVAKKILAADGIIIGKTNLDEFAMGSSTENSAFGPVLNPHDESRVPGGSSGGSAVAVAAGMTDLALGSDTGGSIRQPASFCGIVGMKPSYGRVSRYGLVAFASSLDQIGPFSKCVAGSALLLQTIAGTDPKDATCSAEDVTELFPIVSTDAKNLRVGIPREFYKEGLDPEIRLGLEKTIERLKAQGTEVKELSLSLTEYAIATYYIIATAEASSNLSRYDGVRYGHRSEDVKGLQNMYEKSRSEGFGVEVKRRIMLGTYVLSSGYYDAYYKKAQQVRRLISEEYQQAFQDVDVLLTPTTSGRAFTLGDKISDPLEMYLQDIYTVTANLAGICALSLPVKTTAGEMPYGVQLLAGAFQEKLLFQAAALLESL